MIFHHGTKFGAINLFDAQITAQNRNSRWRPLVGLWLTTIRHLEIVALSYRTTHVVLSLGYISLSNFMLIRCIVLKIGGFDFFCRNGLKFLFTPQNFGFLGPGPLNVIGRHQDRQKAHPWPEPRLYGDFGGDRSCAAQSWSWVTFSKPNPTQNFWTQPNPTHHRHLVWHIRLYRKLYTTTVTRHRQVHSSQLEDLPCIQLVDSTFYKPTVNESYYSAAVLINRQ